MQKLFKVLLTGSLIAASLTGCSTTEPSDQVVLVTHDSFAISDELKAKFENETGLTLKIVKAGDAGAMTNKLVLTKDQPIGDVVFGIDNTLAPLASENGLIDGSLTPIDDGDVCFNYDINWFDTNGIEAPSDIAQLATPGYKNLTVVENPATSSTGMAFLATTVAKFGDPGYLDYWKALKANGVKVAAGWEDAYFTDFSGSSGEGDYPIVLSYSSSPAYELREDGKSATASILNDCFRQTEFAGVLAGAKNPLGAKKLVNFMLSTDFQKALPELMYVYPVMQGVELPKAWEEFAPKATTIVGQQLEIAKSRKEWITAWSALFE
ncbi:MAG: hypothetical protein RL140_670 [Actinomycetota bacterium]